MPSNSEMYDRGALDAELDELNAFYYQHYYYYRRGYDDTRRRLRAVGRSPAPLLLVALVALALAGGAWWVFGRERTPTTAQGAVTPPTALPTAQPTATLLPTTAPTAIPTAAPALAIGARARVVNLSGAPLRARAAPSLAAGVAARIPEGAEVTLREGPVAADGYTWWRIETADAAGWAAERSPEGLAYLEPLP